MTRLVSFRCFGFLLVGSFINPLFGCTVEGCGPNSFVSPPPAGVRCAAAAEQPGLYSQPQLYSRVFGYRNFDAEVGAELCFVFIHILLPGAPSEQAPLITAQARFLLEAYKRHSASPDNQKASSVSVLDLGYVQLSSLIFREGPHLTK